MQIFSVVQHLYFEQKSVGQDEMSTFTLINLEKFNSQYFFLKILFN